jgi:hypothetical protein
LLRKLCFGNTVEKLVVHIGCWGAEKILAAAGATRTLPKTQAHFVLQYGILQAILFHHHHHHHHHHGHHRQPYGIKTPNAKTENRKTFLPRDSEVFFFSLPFLTSLTYFN